VQRNSRSLTGRDVQSLEGVEGMLCGRYNGRKEVEEREEEVDQPLSDEKKVLPGRLLACVKRR
jgi:hypothetical protein